MLLIQMTGYSGAGKSTLAEMVRKELLAQGQKVEVIDGDEFRKNLCSNLGFSKEDRLTNIRRLGFVGSLLARNGIIAIMAAINPFEEARKELKDKYPNVKTIWIKCSLDHLIKRDPKGLYKKAMLPEGHPDKVKNFTGISDAYEEPASADLVIETEFEPAEVSTKKILEFISREIQNLK